LDDLDQIAAGVVRVAAGMIPEATGLGSVATGVGSEAAGDDQVGNWRISVATEMNPVATGSTPAEMEQTSGAAAPSPPRRGSILSRRGSVLPRREWGLKRQRRARSLLGGGPSRWRRAEAGRFRLGEVLDRAQGLLTQQATWTLVRILPANGICPHRSDALLLLPGSGSGALAGIDPILGGIMK
jgi:hypothetical protein